MSIEAAQEEFSGDQAGNMHVCMYHIFFFQIFIERITTTTFLLY